MITVGKLSQGTFEHEHTMLAYSIAKVFDVKIEDLFDFREEEK